MTRKNQNLTPDEAAALRRLAEYHGITASSGPYAGKGSVFALQLAIAHGDLAVVSLDPDDRHAVAEWLLGQIDQAPAHFQEVIRGLASELLYDRPEREPWAPSGAPPAAGPINTMEG